MYGPMNVKFPPSLPRNFCSFKNGRLWDKRYAVWKKKYRHLKKKLNGHPMALILYTEHEGTCLTRLDGTTPQKTCIFMVTTVTTSAISQCSVATTQHQDSTINQTL